MRTSVQLVDAGTDAGMIPHGQIRTEIACLAAAGLSRDIFQTYFFAFLGAGLACLCAALCYAEIASMIPVAGSAYTYSYATIGELLAWTVGWALIMEYAIAASARR